MSTTARLRGLCLALSALCLAAAAQAETYPAKPLRLVVGFGAGGITDLAGRVVAQALGEELGQQVIVDNRPGASGSIGAAAVAQAPADGYTLLLGTVGTQVVNKMLYTRLSYDPAALTPVSLLSNSPFVLAVSAGTRARNLAELVALGRAQPGTLNFGSAGNGSAPHLCLELLRLTAKADLAHVPFKSGAEAVNAAVGGQVDATCDAITVIAPQARAGRLKMLALAADHRNAEVPDLSTTAEQGLPALQVGSWNALLGPAGLGADKVEVLNRALARAMARPAVQKRFAELGIDSLPLGTKAYAAQLASETAKWSRVVQAAGTRLD